jgi:hypothetical protein
MSIHRVHTAVTRHGLEVTVAAPWHIASTLAFYGLAGMIATFVFVMIAVHFTGAAPDSFALVETVFGRTWLILGAAMAVVLVARDRLSNEHFILGPAMVERQFRNGRIVLNRERYPLAWISNPGFEERRGQWRVAWHWRGSRGTRWMSHHPLSREDAEQVTASVRDWLQNPVTRADKGARDNAPLALLHPAVSMLSSRFGVAVPLLLAVAGLVFLAQGWQLYAERELGGAAITDGLQVSDGQLRDLRWVIDPTTAYQGWLAELRLEAAVDYQDEEGPRTLWLASRSSEALPALWQSWPRVAATLGIPAIRFVVPPSVLDQLPAGSRWAQWSDLVWSRRSDEDDTPYPTAARLLTALDDPLLYLTIGADAYRPDLRVAYPPGRPGEAMLLSWWQAEQTARAHVSWQSLLPAALLSAGLVLLSLPGVLVRSLHHRWLARGLVLLLVLAVPLWAVHASNIPRWLGVDEQVEKLTAELLRLHSSEQDHLWLVATPPPAAAGMELEWTLEASAALPLLEVLGIADAARHTRWTSAEQAIEQMITVATAAFAAMSDAQLTRFAIDYVDASRPDRHGSLHAEVISPAFCSQRPRLGTGFNYERYIDMHMTCDSR